MPKLEEKPRIYLEEYRLKNAANDYGMADEKWNFKKFTKKFRIVIVRMDNFEMEFDLIGIQPAFANAFRRLMLSEVPSMAIEKVMISNNTSIIQDEVLAHRLGLIPLKADPRLFEYRPEETGPRDTPNVSSLHIEKIPTSYLPGRISKMNDNHSSM
ncbi:unnamed protein product, partial [Iphiclides podalirius]